ncbi:PEP-CTERM sorting domain-containing protein [Chlorobium phaeovibrioides]|uniref:PEP-CTERM sorting domain-containing protein n=1 Tax=Chlorobium phaeovibrioides TaxID=1094 RepID=A0ABW9UMU3_CHLPH|nr:PEP-CTERM sorting domain-containing protein [Chlorobium phaeovibrioides]MWV54393.1 PEP-CTERM sorting domain-containing protein [Chlorobium phaeovibrioides]
MAVLVMGAMGLSGQRAEAAAGDLINIKFNTGYTGSGVIGTETDTWNTVYQSGNAVSTNTNIKLATSTVASGVGFSSTWTGMTTDTSNTFASNIYTENASSAITFTGLSAGDYTLYVYTPNDVGDLTLSLRDAPTYNTYNGTISAGDTEYDYVVLETNVGIDGILTMDYGGTGIDYINGIQLLQATDFPAPVPEPASMVLLGVGGGFVAWRLRRRKALEEAGSIA